MKFCQDHWDQLRLAIDKRGLMGFVPEGGERAAAQLADQLRSQGEITVDNFDPLTGAMFAIMGNCGTVLEQTGNGHRVLYLLADDQPEDDVEHPDAEPGQKWPRCPLCYLNLAHKLTCKDSRCVLDKERGYDWMIDRAAEDQEKIAEGFSL